MCVFKSTRAIPARQIFPESLNHWKRLQKARVAAEVLLLSLQKQREGKRGGTLGGEKEGEESRVRMSKNLTRLTVKTQGYRQGTQAGRRKHLIFLYVDVKLDCSTANPTTSSWCQLLLKASPIPLEPWVKRNQLQCLACKCLTINQHHKTLPGS